MGFHGNKRKRHQHRHTQDSRPNFDFTVDDELYKSNYSAAESLRRRILSDFSLESHQLPPSLYRNVAKLEVVNKRWKSKTTATHRCFFCSFKYNFSNNIISKSNSVTLILDSFKNCILVDQLLLVSNSHVQNTLYLDDSSYTEFRNYQKTLVYMFQQVDKSVIFIEISLNDKHLQQPEHTKDTNHCKIECYPVPNKYFDDAKGYFLKALDEMGSNWSQSKRLNITGKTGVRGTIPKGFDYIHVDFCLSGEGFARVVEDPSKLRYTFGRNIISGVMNMDQLERAFIDNEQYNKSINNIRRSYRNFDWTVPHEDNDQ